MTSHRDARVLSGFVAADEFLGSGDVGLLALELLQLALALRGTGRLPLAVLGEMVEKPEELAQHLETIARDA